ncbi:restriction endonuclease [Fictibacillus enclensis]|uniref:restriction endonuclease n=1 Tax=Fictibacillus enclensis TaxID=1017270 RepID=UPI0025A1B8A3|nr:restriction endonuclease [Fictibacillus enclensis]MDM5198977.1 restriction endonuclease [Fictibacillus enclensis]
MSKTLHLVLKFPVDYIIAGGTTDTITEHKQLCEYKNRLIWGQGSNKSTSVVTKKNRDRVQEQISNGIDTYSFFLANNKGERELYVGKMINIFDKGEIPEGSPLTEYIPSYYSSNVGTENDRSNLYVDVNTFFKIDLGYIDNMTVESSGNKIPFDRNSTPTFLVNINIELDNLLFKLLNNPEANFQYQVEQEEVPDYVTVVDQPNDKPSKTSGSGSSSYKRDYNTAKTAIVTAEYRCEIDASHEGCISRVTHKNYVEAHHLIPIEYQDDFANSVDVEANIVSLCVGCHKKLHHAAYTVIKPLIEKLYDERIDRLRYCDVELTKSKLLSYYK